jgi:hypothetical protein
MAESPSHRFGQIVGGLLESILSPVLNDFCNDRDLYLDRHGERVGVRAGKKVSWEDKYGNVHDLDFVIEKGGSGSKRGRPVAFIEAAWRRYTKHSRAKAQEIQGAVLPIKEKYELDAPFLGAVLAGVFTDGSLNQLRSMGFEVVYLPYETVVAAFQSVGIDARFDEDTPDRSFAACVEQIEALSDKHLATLRQSLYRPNKEIFDAFFTSLRHKLDRLVKRVTVTPLFGDANTFEDITQAAEFLTGFDAVSAAGEFRKYELTVTFSNGDQIQGTFASKERAIEFLSYVSS